MPKGQRGNKEAKKPKKVVSPPQPGGLAVPAVAVPARTRHK